VKSSISGVLVLDKPAGISSRQALDRVTYLLPRVKMGHAGTLDPMATGVLVVCVGKATRLIPYVQRMRKEYQATLRLGQRSETHDLESEVENMVTSEPIAREKFETCLENFRGDIQQVPPKHSAVHVDGRRAYELARAGEAVELEPRLVRIEQLVCTRFEFPDADLEIECSSGTYVRSLVRDIGDELGCGAVMTRLIRTRIGVFRLDDAISPNELTRTRVLESLRPAGDAVQELPRVCIPSDRLDQLRHGRAIETSAMEQKLTAGEECALIDTTGQILAVAQMNAAGRTIQPRIVLIGE
jgi:tRNA pseudouridine55 synthase